MGKAIYNKEIKITMDRMLLILPQVMPGKMFGYPAYYIDRKLFACVYENGVGVKVPESLAQQLINEKGIDYFQPLGRRRMREWIQINRENQDDYFLDLEIFKESINYVSSLGN
jgi:hypothetical protein